MFFLSVLLFCSTAYICYETIGGPVSLYERPFKKILYFYVLILTAIAFLINPPEAWDLFRHYEQLDNIRSGIGLRADYAAMPTVNIMFHLCALLPINHFLPAITIFLEGLMIIHIIWNYSLIGEEKNTQSLAAAFIISIAFLNITHSISSIRNGLAFVMCSYAIFMGIFKKKRIIPILIFVIAVGLHPSSLVIAVLYYGNLVFKRLANLKCVCALMLFPVLRITLKLLSGLPFFGNLYHKLLDYGVNSDYQLDIYAPILIFTVIFMLWFIAHYSKSVDKNTGNAEYVDFAKLYFCATLGAVSSAVLFTRIMYLSGIIFFPLLEVMLVKEDKKKKEIILAVMLVLTLFMLLYTNKELFDAMAGRIVSVIS